MNHPARIGLGVLAGLLWSFPHLASGATFEPLPLAPESGVQVLGREVAEEQVGRRLFGNPYSSVVIGTVDVYDVFPYVESRYFVVVSDPAWDRLIITATGSGRVTSFDGVSSALGPLAGPRGLAVDAERRVYVCDTENDRIVVLQASSEFDRLELRPVLALEGLARPYDVAVSDSGTPFDGSDDRLYVAETGANQVSRFDREGGGFRRTAKIGGLGSGVGRFAGPMAIAVGRESGRSSRDVYVADAHNRRLVRLVDGDEGLVWSDEAPAEADLVTGLETDQWGQLYATAPGEGSIRKWTANLEPVAVLEGGDHPRGLHIPFVTTTDHRSGSRERSGEGRALVVEEWGPKSGLRAWSLGVEVQGLESDPDDPLEAGFLLTDPAYVTLRLESLENGRVVGSRDLGLRLAGTQVAELTAEDLSGSFTEGRYHLVVEARSTYPGAVPFVARSEIQIGETTRIGTDHAVLLGNHPNPFPGSTRLQLLLPPDDSGLVEAEIFDLSGRRVRSLSREHSGGRVDLTWDGRDDRGRELGSGVYFYQIRAAEKELQGRMVRIR